MRALKFRVWDNHNHKIIMIGDDLPKYKGWEIMQFTGLLDKQGKEIYEGDIVPLIVEYIDIKFKKEKVKNFTVMPDNDIVVKLETGESLWFNSKGEHPKSRLIIGEIIGNIYENGDLLKDIRLQS